MGQRRGCLQRTYATWKSKGSDGCKQKAAPVGSFPGNVCHRPAHGREDRSVQESETVGKNSDPASSSKS